MGIPSEHLKRLEVELSSHESWLGTLRRQIEGLEAEAAAHEMMLRLGRDRKLHRVLDELHDQPELGSRMGDDPRSFLEERGVELPDGAVVTVTSDPGGPVIEASLLQRLCRIWHRLVSHGGLLFDRSAGAL